MTDLLREYQDALIVRNVVAHVVRAKEFPSSDALKRYLDEHPKANPSNHSVQDKKSPTKFNRDDKSRWNDALKVTEGLKGIGEKAKAGDEGAKAEVTKRFNALSEHSTAISADALPILKSLKEKGKLSPEAKQLEAAINKWHKLQHSLNSAKDTESQLRGISEMMDAASDMRTLTHRVSK
jgi:hypothetical protein